jgi:hypothetical protein
MAKPTRSPLLGYNHNVKYRGRIFHVQTEDSGPANPRLFTHLYYAGTILASKKHGYDPEAPEDVVRSLMQGQHKQILKELKGAVHDDRVERFFTSRGETLETAEVVAEDQHALDLDAVPLMAPAQVMPEVMAEVVAEAMPEVVAEVVMEATLVAADEAAPVAISGEISGSVAYGSLPPEAIPVAERSTQVTGRMPLPTPPVVVIPPPGARRRTSRQTTPMATSAVVVQRTVSVGGSTPPPQQTMPPPRVRRPAQAIPYVVKEGSHPLATPARPQEAVELPPPRTMVPATAGAANPPRTTAAQTKAVGGEPLVEKSLDEVILAYLAQGGETEPR